MNLLKKPALLGLFLLLLSRNKVQGVSLRPVINKGQSLCHPLHFSDDGGGRSIDGGVCFQIYPDVTDDLDVDVYIDSAGGCWELDDVFLWIGGNETDVPVTTKTTDDDVQTADVHEFPFIKRHIKGRSVAFEVSLLETSGFACPNEGSQQLAAIYATIKSPDGSDIRSLDLIKISKESETISNLLIPFTLSCRNTENETMALPHNPINNHRTTDTHRRTQDCPSYPSTIDFNLTQAEVVKIYNAYQLNVLVTRCESGSIRKVVKQQRNNYERLDGWGDINDQALVAKTLNEGVCYASTMGAESLNPFDQLQNLNPCTMRVKGSDCMVRSGYFDAYNTSYKDEFRAALDSCVASCTGGCPLAISGISQGAAAAVVASIDLRQYSPTTITFGCPRPLHVQDDAPCTDFHADKHYRFINANTDGCCDGGLCYDSVPMGTTSGSHSFGRPLLLDGTDFPIAYPGLNVDTTREPTDTSLHDGNLYRARINHLLDRGCYPVPVGKWGNGHVCNYDDECEGTCVDKTCQ